MQYFWINQRNYEEDKKAQCIHSFVRNSHPHASRAAILNMKEGDICFSITKDGLVSVNSVRKPANEMGTTSDGVTYEVGCSYFPLKEPISLKKLLDVFNKLPTKKSCFDKNGNRIQRYILPLSTETGKLLFDLTNKSRNIRYTEPAGGLPVPKKLSIMFRARQRNPELVEYARWRANFKCEIDPEHHTFTSIASNQPYIEVHHLVPLSRQGDYKFSLDVAANVVALCPMCHKRMHHGILDHEKRIALKKLLSARKENLKEKKIRLTEKTLLSYYHFEFADDEVLLQSKSCSEATVTPGELYRQLQEECNI